MVDQEPAMAVPACRGPVNREFWDYRWLPRYGAPAALHGAEACTGLVHALPPAAVVI